MKNDFKNKVVRNKNRLYKMIKPSKITLNSQKYKWNTKALLMTCLTFRMYF